MRTKPNRLPITLSAARLGITKNAFRDRLRLFYPVTSRFKIKLLVPLFLAQNLAVNFVSEIIQKFSHANSPARRFVSRPPQQLP
jgi:hypothetical protein